MGERSVRRERARGAVDPGASADAWPRQITGEPFHGYTGIWHLERMF
jgi:hypothetical protein